MLLTKKGSEKRRSPRVWVRCPGQVIVVRGLRGTKTLDCTILNKSDGGALVQVDDASQVPAEFYLTFDTAPQHRIVCTVVRRSKKLLAVRYEPQSNCQVRVRNISSI